MGLFNRLKEPVFLNDGDSTKRQLEEMKALEPLLNAEGRAWIRQEIRIREYGILGEQNIAYELRCSQLPMYILHDICLEDNGLGAQIDYLVFTRKLCFVIECKNLYGNLEIDSNGNFIRTIEFGGNYRQEGIYSPLTQNQHHLDLMKKIVLESERGFLSRMLVKKYFERTYKPLVVLANPKTVLNDRYAKPEVREKVVRADQIVTYIKKACKESKEPELSDSKLLAWAESFLNIHKERKGNYLKKYEKFRVGGSSGQRQPQMTIQ